ncbi:hypothetical protein MYO4S_00070 [Serratia phage 4S]|nr:hypothetical protein MYO4S_00070 [Serratia phage 4S]
MFVVCYKDADGFVHPCIDVTFDNILAFETQSQADESLEEHKANLDWLLKPEITKKRTWYGKSYTISTPRKIVNRERRVREFNTLFVKKGRLVL